MPATKQVKRAPVSVEVNNESGVDVDEASLRAIALHAMAQIRVHPDAELAVVLVDEPAMEQLHIQWMDEPGPTDVLSFPMDELRPGRGDEVSAEGILGDIVLCPSFAVAQAEQAGHSLLSELHILTVHGLLHLVGYDHVEKDEEKIMFGLQGDIVASFQPENTV